MAGRGDGLGARSTRDSVARGPDSAAPRAPLAFARNPGVEVAQPTRWRPLNPPGVGPYRRQTELFRLAAPVFRRHGFRGATIKALAHACHLSPAALYHYFPSKAALATYHLDRPRMQWDTWLLDPSIDPLVQVIQVVDLAIRELPDTLLSLELAREIGRRVGSKELEIVFTEGEDLFGRVLVVAAPRLAESEARELARRVLAVLAAASATGLDPAPSAVRARALDLLRLHLAPAGLDAERWARAVAASPPGFEQTGARIRTLAD